MDVQNTFTDIRNSSSDIQKIKKNYFGYLKILMLIRFAIVAAAAVAVIAVLLPHSFSSNSKRA